MRNMIKKLNWRQMAGMIMMVLILKSFCFADVVDRIVAIVNDDIITLSELNKALNPYLIKVDAAGYSLEKKNQIVGKLQQDMLNRMIERKLTEQEAARLNIKVTDDQVNKAIEKIKETKYMSQEDLETALEAEGLTFQEYRANMRQELLRPRLINYTVQSKVVVTDQEVKDYYEAHPENFGGEKEYHLKNILIKSDSYMLKSDIQKNRDKIEMIKSKLNAGESFASLAKQYSEAPNAQESGDLGYFKLSTFSDDLQGVILKLNPGEYSDAIETDRGFQIFYLEDIRQIQGKTLEEVTEEIAGMLREKNTEKKFNSWLDTLQKNSHIKIML